MPRDTTVLSHWHQLFEGFSTSTQDFYASVEAAVRARNLPDIEISRVLHKEGGILSANREYLRVQRKRIAFDICSAPYGGSHFFSWWLAKIPPQYGIFITLGVLIAAFMALGAVQAFGAAILRNSCAGFLFQMVLLVLGLPVILLFFGFLVREGIVGDEEWVLSLPILGYLYLIAFNPATYYRLDTAMMFRDSIRSAVEEVVNHVRTAQGLRALPPEDFAPHEDGGRA